MQGLSGPEMIDLMRTRGVSFEKDFEEADRLGVLHQRRSRMERIDDATWDRIPVRSRPETREVIRTSVVELPVTAFLSAPDRVGFIFWTQEGIQPE
jgi:hypothetical protein